MLQMVCDTEPAGMSFGKTQVQAKNNCQLEKQVLAKVSWEKSENREQEVHIKVFFALLAV